MKKVHYAGLIVFLIILFAVPLVLLPLSEFEGADHIAEHEIEDMDYEPWFDPIWEPPSHEIESLLFVLQAAVGALIIGYFVGYEKGKKKGTN